MSDRDKGLRAADGEIPLATRAICLEHLSRNLQKNCGLAARNIFNSTVRFALTEEKLQTGMDELQGDSPSSRLFAGHTSYSLGYTIFSWQAV